jgi:hypothetical protein
MTNSIKQRQSESRLGNIEPGTAQTPMLHYSSNLGVAIEGHSDVVIDGIPPMFDGDHPKMRSPPAGRTGIWQNRRSAFF